MNINAEVKIPQSPPTVKLVATYCRVSTEDQEREGTSLDTQHQACLEYCQKHGYQPIHQFTETASGLTLDRPQLNELRQFVRTGEIQGVVIYCLDRLSREATEGVILRDELDKYNVSLESVTEDIDQTTLGKAITYLRNSFAQLEAEKIKERTTRGLMARVKDKRLPVTYRQPFGYSWDKETNRLIPNSDYDTAKLIVESALNGKSYDYIITELKKRGILSPTGLPEWNKHTISAIMRNPVYAGKFYAFKSKTKEPTKRNGTYYGKTSKEILPTDQWLHIPEIEVADPIMTMDQRATLLDQLIKRQNMAQRNAKTNYLLRGMVFCETHQGKKGEPRVYHGQPHHKNRWRYSCPVGKCYGAFIDGPELENFVVIHTSLLFFQINDKGYKALLSTKKGTVKSLESEIKKLRQEHDQIIGKMVKLEDSNLGGKVTQEVYSKLKNQYQNRLAFIQSHQDKLLEEIAQINKTKNVAKSIRETVKGLRGGLVSSVKTFEEESGMNRPEDLVILWQKHLRALNFEIHIHPLDAEGEFMDVNIRGKRIKCELRYDLPILDDIALHSPAPG